VTRDFDSILEEGGAHKKVQTDGGKSFFSNTFQKLMKNHNIIHFATVSDLKASVVERFNRTLKEGLWKYFTAHNTHRYVDIVQDLVNLVNSFYEKELQKVQLGKDKVFHVEEILDQKREQGKKMAVGPLEKLSTKV
jgi:hypothetical protein